VGNVIDETGYFYTEAAIEVSNDEPYTRIDAFGFHDLNYTNNLLAVAGTTVLLWDINAGELVYEIILLENEYPIETHVVAFAPASNLLGIWNFNRPLFYLWDVDQNKEIFREDYAVRWVSFSQDGSLVALALDDNRIVVLDTNDGHVVSTFLGHIAYLYDMKFIPDRNLIISSDGDGRLLVWDALTGNQVSSLNPHSSPGRSGTWIDFNHDNSLMAVTFWPDQILIWSLR
jgi:WD40 repeat protein